MFFAWSLRKIDRLVITLNTELIFKLKWSPTSLYVIWKLQKPQNCFFVINIQSCFSWKTILMERESLQWLVHFNKDLDLQLFCSFSYISQTWNSLAKPLNSLRLNLKCILNSCSLYNLQLQYAISIVQNDFIHFLIFYFFSFRWSTWNYIITIVCSKTISIFDFLIFIHFRGYSHNTWNCLDLRYYILLYDISDLALFDLTAHSKYDGGHKWKICNELCV